MNNFKKIYWLLTVEQRRSVISLLFLMFIGMLLETLGIGMVIPVLSVMMSENFISDYPMLKEWHEMFGSPNQIELIIGSFFNGGGDFRELRNTGTPLLLLKEPDIVVKREEEIINMIRILFDIWPSLV